MGGPFSKANRPTRPGGYVNFEVDATIEGLPGFGGVVHLPVTSDWGATGQVVSVGSIEAYTKAFGKSETAGLRAVRRAFQGEGTPGNRGATVVQAFRIAGSAKAKSTITLKNIASTPADALRLTAIFHGTRGDGLRAAVVNNPGDSTKNDLIIYDGPVEVERFTHLDPDLDGLAAQVNALSQYFTATVLVPAVALAIVAATSASGGNNGSTLTVSDFTDWLSAVEGARFSVVAAQEITDTSVVAAVRAWIQGRNLIGKRVMGIFGGALDETVASAVTRAATLNDPNVLTLGGQNWIEAGVKRSGAEMAAWLAGVVAARGDSASLTYARNALAYPERTPLSNEVEQAMAGGVIVADTDSDPNASAYLVKGVTSFTSKNDQARPYLIYKNPKFVRTMQLLDVRFTEVVASEFAGRFTITKPLRGELVTRFTALCDEALQRGAIQPGYTVDIDGDPPATDLDEFVQLRYGLAFGRSLEQVFNTVHVR